MAMSTSVVREIVTCAIKPSRWWGDYETIFTQLFFSRFFIVNFILSILFLSK